MCGLAVASYLTLFQLGVLEEVWDPWFDSPTVLELTAPVPDAAAGVLAYGTELVLLVLGAWYFRRVEQRFADII